MARKTVAELLVDVLAEAANEMPSAISRSASLVTLLVLNRSWPQVSVPSTQHRACINM